MKAVLFLRKINQKKYNYKTTIIYHMLNEAFAGWALIILAKDIQFFWGTGTLYFQCAYFEYRAFNYIFDTIHICRNIV